MRVLEALRAHRRRPGPGGRSRCGRLRPAVPAAANALPRTTFYDPPDPLPLLAENSTGFGPVGGPVLLLQGDADQAILAAITGRVAERLGGAGSVVDHRTVPGLGHDTIPGVVTGIEDGAADQILARVADRFAGRPARSTC